MHTAGYAKRREKAGEPKLISHMTNMWQTFCAVRHRRTGFRVSKQNRDAGKDLALDIASKRRFGEQAAKPILTAETLRALQKSAWFNSFRAPIQKRLNIIFFLACVVSTAARPSTFVRPALGHHPRADLARPDTCREWHQAHAAIRKSIKGAEYVHFLVHALPPAPGSTMSRLIALYKPIWSKTHLGKGPLVSPDRPASLTSGSLPRS